jgi:adhesin/invasin
LWTRTAGTGTPATATSTTAANGQASLSYTLGATAGQESVRASVAGVTTQATFTATAIPGNPADIGIVSGNGQAAHVGQALQAPLVVKVADAGGNAVAGVAVSWAATNGTIAQSTTTDAQGQTSASLTVGTTPGPVTAIASITSGTTTKRVTFSATATVGAVGSIVVVSGNSQRDTVRRTLAAPFVVRVADSFNNPVSGATVTWTRTAGSGTPVTATSTTNANGQASLSYTLGATPGQETITASAAGVATPATFMATAVAAGPAAIAVVSGDNQTGQVGQALPATLVVKVTDAAGFPVAGVAVNWSATNGTIAQSTTTDAQGQTSASLILGAAAGPATAIAAIQSGTTTKSVTFNATATPGAPANIVIASGNNQTAQAGQALPVALVVKVTDASGNTVAGVGVTWSATNGTTTPQSPATDAQGQASASLTLGPTAGLATATATIGSGATAKSVTFSATATVGGAASIVVVSGSAQRDTVRRPLASPFVVRVVDNFGNAVSGAIVSWARTAGSGTLGAATSNTNANGQASMTYTLGATPGQESISASVPGVATAAMFTATAVPAGPAAIAIVSGTGQTAPAGQALAAPLVVKVTDVGGFPVAGVSVNWTATNGTITPQSTTTDAQGQTSASLTLGTTAGPATAIASITSGTTTKSVTFTATALPGAPANIAIVSGNGQSGPVGQALVSPLVVKITDASGNAVAGAGVSWSATNGTITQNTTTDTQGQSSASLTLGTTVGPATATATIGSGATAKSVTFAATATAGAAANIAIVSGNNQTAQVGQTLPATLVVKVTDAGGNAVSGVGVTWSATNGTIPQSTTTDAQGQTSASLTLGTVAGAATATATIGSGATAKSVTFAAIATPGAPASIAIVSGNNQSAQVGLALPAALVVKVTDASGNAVAAGIAVTWSATNGTIPQSTTTDAQGQTSASLTLGTVAGAATATATIGSGATAKSVTFAATATAGAAANIAIVSGNNQTAQVGQALPAALVAKVTDASGNAVAGITVTWTATNGSVPQSTTTNAQGQTSASLTLGSVAGPASATATIGSGATAKSVTFSATATAGGVGSIVVVSGNSQRDTVRRALAAPFVVRVADSFGNPVSGVTVSWARTAGSGTPVTATSTTNANGQASLSYTLGATPGQETITASAAGVATPATFMATAVAAGPAVIAIVSGNNQTGQVGLGLPAALVVKVTDAGGFPVVGIAVTWSATNGTITPGAVTDAQGQTSASLTVGPAVGSATAVASISTGTTRSVTFSATVQPGPVAKLVIGTQPTTTAAQTPIKPAVTVELRDAAGNLTPSTNSVTIALGANPGQATLTGTLTRAAVGGVATFDDLRISNPAKGYTLVASSAGVPSITSVAFDVVNALTLRFFGTQPTTATSGVPLNPQPAVRVFDATGQSSVAGQPVTVTASSGTLSGTTVVTSNADGVAAFSNLTLTGSGRIILTFSAPGATPLAEPIDVSQGSIVFIDAKGSPIVPPPTAVTMIAGQLPDDVRGIRVQDATGAGIPSVSVHFSVSTAGTKLLEGDALSDANGSVTLTSLGFDPKTLNKAGVYDLVISVPGFNQLKLNVTVLAGAAVRFGVTAANNNPKPGEADLITAQLLDQFSNPVASSLSVRWSPTGGQLTSFSGETDGTGKATATFVPAAGIPSATVVVSVPGSNISGSITLTLTPGLSLGSSVDAARLRNGNELKHGLSGETRIGADTRQ